MFRWNFFCPLSNFCELCSLFYLASIFYPQNLFSLIFPTVAAGAGNAVRHAHPRIHEQHREHHEAVVGPRAQWLQPERLWVPETLLSRPRTLLLDRRGNFCLIYNIMKGWGRGGSKKKCGNCCNLAPCCKTSVSKSLDCSSFFSRHIRSC